jgi:hypothetical protein
MGVTNQGRANAARYAAYYTMNDHKIKEPNIVNNQALSGFEERYIREVGMRIEFNLRTHYNDNRIYDKCGKASHQDNLLALFKINTTRIPC